VGGERDDWVASVRTKFRHKETDGVRIQLQEGISLFCRAEYKTWVFIKDLNLIFAMEKKKEKKKGKKKEQKGREGKACRIREKKGKKGK